MAVNFRDKPGLFDRLPLGLFGPLAFEHAPRYMAILTRLYEDIFGPDGEISPDDGFPRRHIIETIETYLRDDPWPTLNDEERMASVDDHAQTVFRRLVTAGWIEEENVPLRVVASMKPAVQQFLGLLIQFAERGPQFIGGAVQVIYNQLRQVAENPAEQAAGFHQAAKEARALVEALAATRVRAREALERLSEQETTARYAAAYFDDYVIHLYIGDYHQLRNENHPLKHRHEITSIVAELRENASARASLLTFYRENARGLGTDDPELALERDFSRFNYFHRIEEYLERVDAAVNLVNRQALSFLQYSTRLQGRVDTLVDTAIARIVQDERVSLFANPIAFNVGLPFAEARLRLPRVSIEGDRRVAIRKPAISLQMKAVHNLRSAMRVHRQIGPHDLEAYVRRHIGSGNALSSDDFTIASIKDFCSYVALSRLALRSRGTRRFETEAALPGYRVLRDVETAKTSNDFLSVPRFLIERRPSGNGRRT